VVDDIKAQGFWIFRTADAIAISGTVIEDGE
jgi:hypothetical protein